MSATGDNEEVALLMTIVREAQVRDSLAACLEKLEPGLVFLDKEARLPSSVGTTGFIDLLAQDGRGRYVLIEVKKSEPATRETLHEILKYLENAKSHLGLRENELRVIVASVEWRELLATFSSFVRRTTCQVEGYELEIDATGSVIGARIVEPLSIVADRVLAPWHELRFYRDQEALRVGIESHERANAAKNLESFVLVILDAPSGHSQGYPSTKQITNRRLLGGMAPLGAPSITEVQPPLYKGAIYFAMHQPTKDEYIRCLSKKATEEVLGVIADMDDEEALLTLHQAVLAQDPRPDSDFFEIGYPAKFHGRLIDEEGWRVREIRRYGYFKRNALLTDDTILQEISGSQGNSGQGMKMSFRPHEKSEVAEVRRRMQDCLANNTPWRSQIDCVLNELVGSGERRQCYIQVYCPSSAITTVYLAATRENGVLYIPSYQIRVPEDDTQCMYFGALVHNGSTARTLKQIVDEFYDGSVDHLLFTLQWGGYEARDVQIIRRLGLRYRTFRCVLENDVRSFAALEDHEWEPCEPIDAISAYFSFLEAQEAFTTEVCELYASRWDGHIVSFPPNE